MAKIIPKVGSRVKFNLWHDIERFSVYYTDAGDGVNRPSSLEEWTGTVVKIDGQPFRAKLMSHRNTYWIKRDFDGQEMPFNIKNIIGYVN